MAKKKPAEAKTGVIYARYSSHNQKEESIEQQVEECTAFAAANGIEISHVYADKALSGRTDKRPQFQRMMRDAEKGGFDVVIAYKSNRIARDMFTALKYENTLDKYGIKTLYAKEEFGGTAAGRFALRTMMNVNQFYSENMSEDIKRGMRDNAEACKVNGSLPFGYKKGEDGKYAIDEPRATVVREIFSRALSGTPYVDIIRDLNSRGITTKTGKPFTRTSFQKMLRNERYIGVYEHSGIRNENGIPPIISKEDFFAMQQKLNFKEDNGIKRRTNAEYLLTGKLFCGSCGAPMTGISGTSRSGELHYYYACSDRRGKSGCKKKNVRRDFIENLVIDMTLDLLSQADIIDFLVSSYGETLKQIREESELPLMEAELSEDKKALANIMKAIEAGIFNSTTAARMSELEDSIKNLERDIMLQRAGLEKVPTEAQFRFYLETMRNKEVDKPNFKKDIISCFIKCVRLWDDRIEIEYYITGGGDDNLRRSKAFKSSYKKPTDSTTENGAECSCKDNLAPPSRRRRYACGGFCIFLPGAACYAAREGHDIQFPRPEEAVEIRHGARRCCAV